MTISNLLYDVVVNGAKHTRSPHISYRCSQPTPRRHELFPFVTTHAAIFSCKV